MINSSANLMTFYTDRVTLYCGVVFPTNNAYIALGIFEGGIITFRERAYDALKCNLGRSLTRLEQSFFLTVQLNV